MLASFNDSDAVSTARELRFDDNSVDQYLAKSFMLASASQSLLGKDPQMELIHSKISEAS